VEKINVTQQKQTTQEQNSLSYIKNTQNAKPKQMHKQTKPKPTLIFKNCSHVCAYHCAQLSYTAQHRTVPIIVPLIVQTIVIAQTMWQEGRGSLTQVPAWLRYNVIVFIMLFDSPITIIGFVKDR